MRGLNFIYYENDSEMFMRLISTYKNNFFATLINKKSLLFFKGGVFKHITSVWVWISCLGLDLAPKLRNRLEKNSCGRITDHFADILCHRCSLQDKAQYAARSNRLNTRPPWMKTKHPFDVQNNEN